MQPHPWDSCVFCVSIEAILNGERPCASCTNSACRGAHHQLEGCVFTLQKLVSSTRPRFSRKASCQTFINTTSIGPRKFASGIWCVKYSFLGDLQCLICRTEPQWALFTSGCPVLWDHGDSFWIAHAIGSLREVSVCPAPCSGQYWGEWQWLWMIDTEVKRY